MFSCPFAKPLILGQPSYQPPTYLPPFLTIWRELLHHQCMLCPWWWWFFITPASLGLLQVLVQSPWCMPWTKPYNIPGLRLFFFLLAPRYSGTDHDLWWYLGVRSLCIIVFWGYCSSFLCKIGSHRRYSTCFDQVFQPTFYKYGFKSYYGTNIGNTYPTM